MKQLEKQIGNFIIRIFGPTHDRKTWRVNVMNDEDGAFARAFFDAEDAALDAVESFSLGLVPTGFTFE